MKTNMNAAILKHAKENDWQGLFQSLIDEILIVNKDELEFHLMGVSKSGISRSDEMEVLYQVRKTSFCLKHHISY